MCRCQSQNEVEPLSGKTTYVQIFLLKSFFRTIFLCEILLIKNVKGFFFEIWKKKKIKLALILCHPAYFKKREDVISDYSDIIVIKVKLDFL
jgi:hypothetical protein